jgi:5-(carboxyamino)imidazole ribonucleotide synthase
MPARGSRRGHEVDDEASLAAAIETLGLPLLLKTRRFGYDGKGQAWVHAREDAAAAWQAIGCRPAVAEKGMTSPPNIRSSRRAPPTGRAPPGRFRATFIRAASCAARTVPPGAPIDGQVPEAVEIAAMLAERLGHVGVMTVEYFACADGPVVNEIAPRVHNSGHWTIEGSATSQFEQHIRAICGLPLRDTRLVGRAVSMDNLIGGDVGNGPRWSPSPMRTSISTTRAKRAPAARWGMSRG